MEKIRKKILISLLLVISIFAVGLKSFAKVDVETIGDVEDKRKFDGVTVDYMINYVAENGSEWYNLDIGKIMASKLKSGGADYKKKFAYCIDPHTSTKGSNYYKIVNLIDIKNIDDVKVYGLNSSKDRIRQYSITGDQRRWLFDYSYLVFKSIDNDERDTKFGTNKGAYKISTTYNLWGNFEKYTEVGISKVFDNKGFTGELSTSYYNKYITSAYKNYTKDILKIKLEDKTNEDNLKSQTRIVNNQEKTYLGPYKVACGGVKIDNIKVTINGKEKTYKKFASKVGGSLSDISKLKSNKNFYIVIDEKLESEDKITKITMTTEKYKMFEARIALLDGSGECQNFEIFRAREREKDLEITLPNPPKVAETELKIKKVDADNNDIALENVKFILKHSKYGYLKEDRTYTDNENEAYIFKTDKNGMIKIKNVNPGQYMFIEKENPNKGYEENVGKKVLITHKEGDTTTHIIENKKTTEIDLTIKKVGKKNDGTTEKLPNVGFKLKHSTYGYVIKLVRYQ